MSVVQESSSDLVHTKTRWNMNCSEQKSNSTEYGSGYGNITKSCGCEMGSGCKCEKPKYARKVMGIGHHYSTININDCDTDDR